MINGRVFSLLKNVLMFLINKLYREWKYMLGSSQSYGEKASKRGDLYVKQLIENIIHDRVKKCDPYVFDRNAAISWGITSVVLRKADITGLSTLHRTNTCALTEVENKSLINANLGVGPLSYQRQITLRLGNYERRAAALISLNDMNFSVDFSVEKETGRNGFLLNFAINELNGFKLSITGFGYFDWIINLFLNFWTWVLGRIIRNLLENELEQYILVGLPKYQFPVEGISYRNEPNINLPQEDFQVNQTSTSEAFCMKQNDEKPKCPRLSPIDKSLYDGYNSTAKDFEFNLETTNTSESFLQSNQCTSEMNSFYLPAESSDICRESWKNSCNEDLKSKATAKFYPFSVLSRETADIYQSINRIKEELDSISQFRDSWSLQITANNSSKISECDCSLVDLNIPDDFNDIGEAESDISETTDTATSSPAKNLENEHPCLLWGMLEKTEESKMEDFPQMLRDSFRNLIKNNSENLTKNIRQSKSEVFFEVHECSFTKNADEKALAMDTRLPVNVSNYDSLPSMKIKSHIDENIFDIEVGSSGIDTGTFNNLNRTSSETPKVQTVQDEKMFEVSYEQKGTKDSSTTRCISDESGNRCRSAEGNFSASNLDVKLCSKETYQNDFSNCSTLYELQKDLKFDQNPHWQEIESQIEDSEFTNTDSYRTEILPRNRGGEPSKIRCVSYSDGVDDQTGFKYNILDLMKLKRVKAYNFFSEADIETVSTSSDYSEKYENEDNVKIPFKYLDVHIEEGLRKDALIKTSVFTVDYSSSSEELNISSDSDNEDVVYNNLLEKLKLSLNDGGIKCTDCMAEVSSIAGLKLKTKSNKPDSNS